MSMKPELASGFGSYSAAILDGLALNRHGRPFGSDGALSQVGPEDRRDHRWYSIHAPGHCNLLRIASMLARWLQGLRS